MTCIDFYPSKNVFFFLYLQFQFKEIVLTEEEKRLLAKEGLTIPSHMPLTKVWIRLKLCLLLWQLNELHFTELLQFYAKFFLFLLLFC